MIACLTDHQHLLVYAELVSLHTQNVCVATNRNAALGYLHIVEVGSMADPALQKEIMPDTPTSSGVNTHTTAAASRSQAP
jgi:hypothetical protein